MSSAHRDDQSAHPPGCGLSLTIADPGGLLPAGSMRTLRAHAVQALERLGRAGEVRVKLVADAEMSAAHAQFSKIEGTTDVLTFDLSEGATARGGDLDMDILACVDEARRQASAHGHDVEREILLYILHGTLHCLGYDDHDEAQFAKMHALEDEILEAIGVGATFDSARPARRAGPPGGARS